MKSVSPVVAVAATLLLHAALVATIVIGLPSEHRQEARPAPVEIRLMQAPVPVPPAPHPVAPQPVPVQQAKKEPEPKHRPPPKHEAVRPRDNPAPAPVARVPAPAVEAKPPSASTNTRPAAPSPTTPPAPAANAAAAPPVKTTASDAAYAASNRKPPYPRLSRINEEQGTVVLRVLVKADGTAGAVEIKTSSGYPLLDESAKSTVQTWRFKPATIDGKPVSEWYQLAIPFTLQNN